MFFTRCQILLGLHLPHREPLPNQALPVSLQKRFQIPDLLLQLAARVRVPHQFSLGYSFDDNTVRMDIALLLYGRLRGLKGVVGRQDKSVGIVN